MASVNVTLWALTLAFNLRCRQFYTLGYWSYSGILEIANKYMKATQ